MYIKRGEVKEIGIEVINQLGETFIIEAAEYQITKKEGTEIEKGIPSIEDHKLTALFSATQKGEFYMIFKYHIATEIIKAKVFVEVIE